MEKGVHEETVWHYDGGRLTPETRPIIVEAPFAISVNGRPLATLLCTPTELRALAIGFLVNEGFIAGPGDIRHLDLRADGQGADIWLDRDPPQPALRIRTSGCTGGMTFHEAAANDFRLAPGPMLTPTSVLAQMRALIGAGTLYRQARGVHTSALSDGENLLVVAEDVGRHNTLDKIAGLCQLQAIPTEGRILLTTGRVSSEMLYKAAHMGIPIVISRTSPTVLTVRLARSWGMTLIGYAHSGGFTIYAGPERLEEPARSALRVADNHTLEGDLVAFERKYGIGHAL